MSLKSSQNSGGGTFSIGTAVVVPTTGFNNVIPNGVDAYLIEPAAGLASGTLTMPSAPADNMIVRVSTSQTITALVVNANAGQSILNSPTTLVAGGGFAYKYVAISAKWYRLY